MEQVLQEPLIISLRCQLGDHPPVKFAHIVRGEVAQPLPFGCNPFGCNSRVIASP
jgi:hypothetical protein